MSRRQSVFYNALLLTGANLMMRGVSMAFQVYLVSRVGAAGIGLLTLVGAVGMLAATVGGAGARVAVTALVAEEHASGRPGAVHRCMQTSLRYALVTSVLVGALTVLLAELLATQWLGDLRTASSIRILGATLPLTCLWGVMGGYFTATGRVRQLVRVQFADRLMDIAVTAAALQLWAGTDVERGCMAITGGSAVGTALSLLLLGRIYRGDPTRGRGQERPMLGRLLRLSVPVAVSDDLRAGLNTVEHFLIPWGLRRSGASGEAAISSYGTIHGMVFPVLTFPAGVLYAMSDLLVPELSACRAAGHRRRMLHIVRQCLHWTLIFAAAAGGFIWLSAAALGEALYHSAEAAAFLKLYAPMVLLLFPDAIVDGMLKGLLQQAHSVRYNTLTSVLDVVLLAWLLPRGGLDAYFWTFTVTHAVNFYLSIRRLIVVTEFRPELGRLLRIAGAVGASLALCAQLRPGWTAAAAYLLLLAAALRLTGAVDREQMQWLRKTLCGR